MIEQFIDEDLFFFHGETKQDLKLIPNLFNCVLGQYSNKYSNNLENLTFDKSEIF